MNPARKRPKLSHSAPPLRTSEGGTTDEEDEFLLVEEDATDSSLVITMDGSRVKAKKKRRKQTEAEGGVVLESELEIDRQLDQSLETKSKQHNLTAANVKTILHEVITNEHVVAMMKAAINDTEAPPPFELKMTRSKLKEVVERGVVIPAWNLSPIKKSNNANKPPQFVDMALADEDSSDEEYRPDEDEEDETAEDTFQESDLESTASSPQGGRVRDESNSPWQTSRSLSHRLRTEPVPMGPPPPPKVMPIQCLSDSPRAPLPCPLIDRRSVSDSTFLEKLHAVEEELSVCGQSYQPLQNSSLDLMARRTRSKRPLTDVPLGQLEAELRELAPDFNETRSSQDQEEDRDWTDWLRGLMTSDVEEEADDEDDPEYNFLADADEPDLEDYRDDRAVRITKKEVNELMEELFETLKEDLASQDVDEEGHEEEEETTETPAPHTQSSEAPVLDPEPVLELRTVRQQLDFLRKHLTQTKALEVTEPVTLSLNTAHKKRLQQQIQQHVQLLTQIHLLCAPVPSLQTQAHTTRHFLVELDFLGQGAELVMSSRGFYGRSSAFRVCNLQGALQLLEETRVQPINYTVPNPRADSRGHIKSYPLVPAELAWFFATRSVFLYPELLPCASLDPACYCPRRSNAFTAAEDCLLVLGLRTLEGTLDPVRLVSEFLVRKNLCQVRRRILQCCRPGNSDNIVKAFRFQRVVWPMPKACSPQTELRPPIERDERCLPLWIARSLPVLHSAIRRLNSKAPPPSSTPRPRCSQLTLLRSDWSGPFPAGTSFPLRLPKNELEFRRIGFVLLHPPPDNPPITESLGEGTWSVTEEMERRPVTVREEELRWSVTAREEVESQPITEREEAGGRPIKELEKTGKWPMRMKDSDHASQHATGQEVDSQHAPGQRPESDVTDEQQEEGVVRAQNVCVTNGKRVVVWTREADRELLLAVQKGGANEKTFRAVSLRLGNKTLVEVRLRFRDLMTLFHSSNHRAVSCSTQEPIRRQKAPD
ncbi:GON-4-like protein isoform X2 [Periophthalmus magnuspinnatus]|uniref:GON-4-like protein isoform X2 n=1 Tax=Periophthalmus magnuspinnatus TaxID=409849 RepID=UPI0024364D68|nr:GON-4-like protein isoform X2 [Periophthalmus magnuspinnatus]